MQRALVSLQDQILIMSRHFRKYTYHEDERNANLPASIRSRNEKEQNKIYFKKCNVAVTVGFVMVSAMPFISSECCLVFTNVLLYGNKIKVKADSPLVVTHAQFQKI